MAIKVKIHPSITRKTVRIVRAMQRAILAEPKLYDQGIAPAFFEAYNGFKSDLAATCGTACCLAGWAVWASNPDRKSYTQAVKKAAESDSWEMAGAAAIGVTRAKISNLFTIGECWPEPFGSDFSSSRSDLARAQVAVRRLDYFLQHAK